MSEINKKLARDNQSFRVGDTIVGVPQSAESFDDPYFTVGGYRTFVPDANTDEPTFVELTKVKDSDFGIGHARAKTIDTDSYLRTTARESVGVVYKNSLSQWTPIELDPIKVSLLEQLLESLPATDPLDLFVPGFDPRAILPIAVELLFSATDDVVVYSPGTQSNWGTKEDLREEYSRFGLTAESGNIGSAMPLSELFSDAYVSDGTLKDRTESYLDTRLILTKQLEELPETCDPEYLIVNHLARAVDGYAEDLDKFENRLESTTVVTLWSQFTKREREWLPAYGPPENFDQQPIRPDSDAISQIRSEATALRENSAAQAQHTTRQTAVDLEGLLTTTSVKFAFTDDEQLNSSFDDLYSEQKNLDDAGYEDAATKIQNAMMFFRRLPVPADYYDDTIEERTLDGELATYLPKSTTRYIEDFDTSREHGEIPLQETIRLLYQIRDRLADENPLSDLLVEFLSELADDDQTVTIFTPSSELGGILDAYLRTRSSLDKRWMQSSVELVDDSSGRQVSYADAFISLGPQWPTYKPFYIHPRAEETRLLLHQRSTKSLLENHVRQAVERCTDLLPIEDEILTISEIESVE